MISPLVAIVATVALVTVPASDTLFTNAPPFDVKSPTTVIVAPTSCVISERLLPALVDEIPAANPVESILILPALAVRTMFAPSTSTASRIVIAACVILALRTVVLPDP